MFERLSDRSELPVVNDVEFGITLLKWPEQDQHILLIRAFGGLTARMTGVLSAHRLAVEDNLDLFVNWPLVTDQQHFHRMQATMGQLWCPKPDSFTMFSDEAWSSLPMMHNGQRYLQVATSTGYLRPHIMFGLAHGLIGPFPHGGKSNEWYADYQRFFRAHYELHPELQQRVDELAHEGFENRVGLQLRCCGKQACADWDPERRFRAFIKLRLAEQRDSFFYLSSDDEEVAARLDNEFPGKILRIVKRFEINSHLALLDTAVDFELLAKCREAYGTPFSAISIFVSILAGRRVTAKHDWDPGGR